MLLRVDEEDLEKLEEGDEQEVLQRADDYIHGERPDAIVISDYRKGTLSTEVVKAIVSTAGDIPTLYDPPRKGQNLSAIPRGLTVFLPNREEFADMWAETEHAKLARDPKRIKEDLLPFLVKRGVVGNVVLKMDCDGLFHYGKSSESAIHYPTRKREVSDVTGAGDLVAAVVTMGLVAGDSWGTILRRANLAAGYAVEQMGNVILTKEELGNLERRTTLEWKIVNYEEAQRYVKEAQRYGKRVVFTNGCFDAVHAGHVTFLQEAAQMGDILIAALNTDESIATLKGEGRPIMPGTERMILVSSFPFVDRVLLMQEDTPNTLLTLLQPDILVKGPTTETIVGEEIVVGYGGEVVKIEQLHIDTSTTKLIERARAVSC
jgi:D-beta-D-heptose 7-phosphate kinase/D-beta-D-heptose 1-phosphate adenosyltransferase